MKYYSEKCSKQDKKILNLSVNLCYTSEKDIIVVKSDQPNATLYFKFLKAHAQKLAQTKKGIILWNEHFIYGLVGSKEMIDLDEMCSTFKVDKKEVKTSNKID